jgi:hypothetical protein
VDEDHAATVEALRTPGHGAAVIAVGGAGDGDPLGGAPVAARCQVGRACLRRHAATRQFGGQYGGHCVGAPESLEAAEAEASRFVLQPETRHACLPGDRRQIMQQRHCVAVPSDDLRLGVLEARIRENSRPHSVEARIGEQAEGHGAKHRGTVDRFAARCNRDPAAKGGLS